jgi:hypothetical protein
VLVALIATLLILIWEYRARPADAQTLFYTPVVDDSAIEPPPYLGPTASSTPIVPEPPPPVPYVSYFDLPPPAIVLEAPPDIELPEPPTVVIQQMPPIVMTRTCTRDNYYKGGKRYYHSKPHCTTPEPLPPEAQGELQ